MGAEIHVCEISAQARAKNIPLRSSRKPKEAREGGESGILCDTPEKGLRRT